MIFPSECSKKAADFPSAAFQFYFPTASFRVRQPSTAHLTRAGIWEISRRAEASSRLSISSSLASPLIIRMKVSAICRAFSLGWPTTMPSMMSADADIVLEGVNPSCGDDIFLKLKLEGDTIADGAFVGDGCAVSQASADIMLGMIVGKKKEDALKMGEIFLKMIQGEASEDEIDSLEEASALRDISHMPARVKCAVLGWRTLKEALLDGDELS